MIDNVTAKKQVLRLSNLAFFPTAGEAIADLVRAVETARDVETAKKVITAIVDAATSETRCPAPGDLRRAIAEAQRAADGSNIWQAPWEREQCPKCDGTGFIIVERGGLSGAKECECRAKPVPLSAEMREPRRANPGFAKPNQWAFDAIRTAYREGEK